jgi:Actinobacteria/chloroflexi VLRF1 release factor
MARFVGRENVRKRLAPFEGKQARTSYANGIVRIELPGEAIVVRPPFGLAHEVQYVTVRLAPLFAAIADDHIVAALLVRLGGYAVGVFDSERLVASKVGARFVKNRHKRAGLRPTASERVGGLSGQIRSTTAKPRRTRRESGHLACVPIRLCTGGLAVRAKSLQASRLCDRRTQRGTAHR